MYKVEIKKGSLLEDKEANYLVNPSNTELLLGSGVSMAIEEACSFKLQLLMDEKKEYLDKNNIAINQGDIITTKATSRCSQYSLIYHACVMDYTSVNMTEPTLKTILNILKNLEKEFEKIPTNNIRSVLPMMGCGVGGLDIEDVAKLYKDFFTRDTKLNAKIVIYGYSDEDYQILNDNI